MGTGSNDVSNGTESGWMEVIGSWLDVEVNGEAHSTKGPIGAGSRPLTLCSDPKGSLSERR